MKHALFLPPFGELADPARLVEHAVAAENAGWDAVFLWDHVLRREGEPQEIADPWVAMAAVAVATTRIRIGPMVTPITRRRPIKLAREATSLDHLSKGRLTMGLGLGVDTSRELSGFGEITDPKIRGQRLDEGVELLCALWSGERVDFHGEHFLADGVTALPKPYQEPRIPLWFAARGEAKKPVRRAARFEGLFPIEVDESELVAMLDVVRAERGDLDGFDVMVAPHEGLRYDNLAEHGVTWAVAGPAPGTTDIFSVASISPARFFAAS
ncbi:MAG: alkanesulfonate monooxygenase SsuD [Verrucomicrobiales bacterium]|jgi:alkanesulfonate monooxygenase SsuD/methylene tetrahydromethanopterin reductase-like flavin-dependent oxidoreductase (luciferase family)